MTPWSDTSRLRPTPFTTSSPTSLAHRSSRPRLPPASGSTVPRGPAVGARFRAKNHAGRGPGWHNEPIVTVAERGQEFAFSRTEKGAGTVVWRYMFTPEKSGTRVTESYDVTEPVTIFGWFIIGVLYGNKDRRTDLHRGMTQTLQRLAVLAEKTASPS